MTILCATDFSACSQTAVRLAGAMARRGGDSLLLLHAVEPPALEVPDVPIGASGAERAMLADAEVELARQADEIRRTGIAADARVFLGRPAALILEAAREPGVKLVVIGTHGRRGRARLFLGSVAESVVRSAPCPVLVTREGLAEVERWEGSQPLRMAVALDATAGSQAVLPWVGALAKAGRCEPSLVRIYWPPEEATRYGLDEPWSGYQGDPELLGLLERDLRRDTQAIAEIPLPIRFRAAAHDAAEALAEEAVQLRADAIVIAAGKRRSDAWAAVAPTAVLRCSPLPVFCVPRTGPAPTPGVGHVRAVLLATDLSQASKDVIAPAYGLLRAGGGRVELCHVYEHGPIPGAEALPSPAPLDERERARLEAQLRALIPGDAESFGIETRVSVLEGPRVGEMIMHAAERLDADVLAVGSHGRSGVRRALMGSVAEELVRHSPRPVLVVRAYAGA